MPPRHKKTKNAPKPRTESKSFVAPTGDEARKQIVCVNEQAHRSKLNQRGAPNARGQTSTAAMRPDTADYQRRPRCYGWKYAGCLAVTPACNNNIAGKSISYDYSFRSFDLIKELNSWASKNWKRHLRRRNTAGANGVARSSFLAGRMSGSRRREQFSLQQVVQAIISLEQCTCSILLVMNSSSLFMAQEQQQRAVPEDHSQDDGNHAIPHQCPFWPMNLKKNT